LKKNDPQSCVQYQYAILI